MGAVRLFICGLLAAVCRRAEGGIYDHNPFLNKVIVAHPGVVQPVLTSPTPQAVKPIFHSEGQKPGVHQQVNHTHQHPPLVGHVAPNHPQIQAHHTIIHTNYPPLQANYPQIQANYPQIQANYPQIQANYPQIPATFPQIPSIFPQVISHLQPSQIFHQPAVPSTERPLSPVLPAHPAVIPNPPPAVGGTPQPQFIGGLRRLCLRTRGQFPSGRCNTFVNCWDDIAVEQTCPPGLAFNPAGYCDYVGNVDCQGRLFIEVPVPQPQEQPQPQLPIAPVVQLQPQPQLPIPPNVQPQVVVEPDKQVPPLWVGTQPPVIPTQPPVYVPPQPVPAVPSVSYIPAGSVPDARLKSKCLHLRGQFPTDACNRYVDCWDDSVTERECPPGLHFSEKGYCDYDYNVNCQNRTVIKTSFVPNPPKCFLPDGTFKDSQDCSRYYTCINNNVVAEYKCPVGLYFNEMIGVCDYEYRVDCNRQPFIYQTFKKTDLLQKVPAVLMDSALDCRPGRVFRLNPGCTSAALCRSGMTEVIHCPAGMGYDAPSDRCLPLELARCQDN